MLKHGNSIYFTRDKLVCFPKSGSYINHSWSLSSVAAQRNIYLCNTDTYTICIYMHTEETTLPMASNCRNYVVRLCTHTYI